jgi:hypothetical protein
MKPRKLAVFSAGDRGIPGHHELPESFSELRHQNRLWRAAGSAGKRVSSDAAAAGRRQGLKILAREVNNTAAPQVPNSQAEWLWDCTTPEAALTGRSVSVSAIAISRQTAVPDVFFPHLGAGRTQAALQGHGFQPRRPGVLKSWPAGPEGHLPQRLKPEASTEVSGTPAGVPLQRRQTETAMATRETERPSVSHAHAR